MSKNIPVAAGPAATPSPGLTVAVEALMRVSAIGVRRESDRESYLEALEAVLQAARDAGRRDLFEASLHIADNLAILREHPETRAKALLPLLDFPIAMHDCVENPHDSGSADVLLACLADLQWPVPLASEDVSRLRVLSAPAHKPEISPSALTSRRAGNPAATAVFTDPTPTLHRGVDKLDADRLWTQRGAILPNSSIGSRAGAAGTREVSEREQAETTRRELQAQLLESQKLEAISTLAGGIANDFNNILGAVLGNLALVREELGNHPVALQSLEQATQSARRATNLVREILTFSRLQPQNLVGQPLQPVLQESLAMVCSTLPAAVKLETKIIEEPLHVLADASKIQQMLVNLCTNATQALRNGAGRVGVGLERIAFSAGSARRPAALSPGEYAHLWVSDDGCGMDQATRGRIFEPFFTTRATGRGAGMGLSVVHGIVATHHGAITVDSAPDQGSTFHIYFPLVRSQGVAPPPGAASGTGSTAAAKQSGKGKHVLYVDDEDVMLRLAETLLRRQGYRVTCHQDPVAAVAAVRAQPLSFDLVVTDVNMRELSGFEVARELARIRADLPVVVSSGNLSEERRAELQRCGVRGLIHKENTFEELCPAVDRLLHGVVASKVD